MAKPASASPAKKRRRLGLGFGGRRFWPMAKPTNGTRNQPRPHATKPRERPSKRKRKAGPEASTAPTSEYDMMDLVETQKNIALGHHSNIMIRHRKLLSDIGSLISCQPNIEMNDDSASFLERATSSFVIYMKWVEPDECVHIWIGDKQRMFKLELHAVFEAKSEPFILKNSLLSFSCGFDDNEHWKNFKHVLEEIFGSSQSNSIAPDYIYAFTRLGETLHFQIFQVLGIEQSSLQNEMKLTKTPLSFSMKQLEVNSGQSCIPIFDSKKLISQDCSLLNLENISGFIPSNGSLMKHAVEHSCIPNVVFLPYPTDLSIFNGFNSDLAEFLLRYPATYQGVVPGSNPQSVYRDISDPFRIFSRSLILIAGAAIKRKLCVRGLDKEKILVKRGVARLHDVDFVPYTDALALGMFRRIRQVLRWCMPEGTPDDVEVVLGLLKDKPLEAYDLIAHSPVWIPAWDRCHYLEDTYSVFKSDLSLELKISFAETKIRCLLTNWRGKMEQNILLDDVVKHNERMPKGYANKSEEDQEKDREHVKQRKIDELKKQVSDENLTVADDSICALLTCQEFFAKCRHAVVHLPESAKKLGLLPMPPETKNLILSSEFAAVYPSIQEALCQVMSMTAEQLGLTHYFKTDVTYDVL